MKLSEALKQPISSVCPACSHTTTTTPNQYEVAQAEALEEAEGFRKDVMGFLDHLSSPKVKWDKDGNRTNNNKAAMEALHQLSRDMQDYKFAYYKKLKETQNEKDS